MSENPVMTLRWMIDDEEQPDSAEVLWTAPSDGYWISLMTIPEMGYIITHRDEPFTDGQAIDIWNLNGFYIELGRTDAGQLAVALITALINNSDQIIDYHIQAMMTRHTTA